MRRRIGVLTELVERSIDDTEKARRQLAKIDSTAHDLTRQLDSVVWAVDPANDTLESLARYLHGQAEESLAAAGIRCHFANTEAMPDLSLSSTFHHHLLMIAKEALHNAVSHAAATMVTIGIVVQGGYLRIEIADNGRGMPTQAALKSGNGLKNMKSRATTLGGTCEFLCPKSGSGTVVRLTIPLPSIPTA